MIRTQIYLTKEEHQGISLVARTSGQKKSEIIREAIDEFLVKLKPDDKMRKIKKAKGIWKDRDDLDFATIRSEFDRY